MPHAAVVLVLAALVATCAEAKEESATRPKTTQSATRTLTATQRTLMLQLLRAAPKRGKVWFAVPSGDANAASVQQMLQSVFEEAGWTSRTRTVEKKVLNPGVTILVADVWNPPYVDAAVGAIAASGLPVKAAKGYREYVEKQKGENPT